MAANKNALPATPMTSHSFASTGGLDVDVLPASAVQIDFIPDRIARSPSIVVQDPFRDSGDADDMDVDMEAESAPNSATPLGTAARDAVGAGRAGRDNLNADGNVVPLNMPSTPPAMAGAAVSPVQPDGEAADECAPPPPAYTTLANSTRTFHLAPLLNGVPGEVELHTSDGKRFLVHKSVLEKETVFFHIYYGFVPAWRLNLSLEESVGLPPNPHVPSVIMDAPARDSNLPPPPPFTATAGPGPSTSARRSSDTQAAATAGSSHSTSNDSGSNSNGNALGLSGLWSLPKIITNVCASATAAATGVVAGSSSGSSSSSRPGVGASSSSRTSSIDADEAAPLLPGDIENRQGAPVVPPKDEPATPAPTSAPRRSIAAPPPPPPCAPTPTTSPYVWTVPEPSSILYAFLCLIYPVGTLAPSPTYGLNSIDACTKVIRAAMGYQSNKAISLARAHLWGYLYRLENEDEEDRFWAVQRQQRGAVSIFNKSPRANLRDFERERILVRQAVRVYALASYFKFTDLAVLASKTACRVPRDEWARADVSMMGRRAATRLMKLQEIRRDTVCRTLDAAQTEHIMQSTCPCAHSAQNGQCGKRETMMQVWATRCAQVAEVAEEEEGTMDAERVSRLLLDPSETGAGNMEGCVGCMQEYGRCVGLVMDVLSGMPDSVAVIE